MDDQSHLDAMLRYVANIGITAAALRNLGDKGFVGIAREFLAKLDLEPLASLESSAYTNWLDNRTEELMARFPIGHLWGPARKSINIFMTMASLNRFLCEVHQLKQLESEFEVPLDSGVVKELQKFEVKNRELFSKTESPKWTKTKALDSANSGKFQKIALAYATELGIPRGHLDVFLWRPLPD